MLDRPASGADLFVSIQVVLIAIVIGVAIAYGAVELAARTSTWW